MEIYEVISEMLILFFIMAVGYLANKTKILTREGNKTLSKLIVNITLPAMILASVMQIDAKMKGSDLVMLLAVAFGAYLILGIVAYLTPKVLRATGDSRGLYSFMAMFGNVGFIGFPILAAIYGVDAIFYAALFNIPFNILLFSLGILMITPGEKFKLGKETLLNPSLLASLIALLLYLLPISFPQPMVTAVDLLGSITIPGAMLLVGASLGTIPVKIVFGNLRVYIVSLIKLLVCPLLVWLAFGWFITNPLILGAAVITTAMPIATNATMLAMEYGGDETLTSQGIFISTVLSVFTIPLIILLVL